MGFCLKATSSNRWPKATVPYQIDGTTYPVGSAGRQSVLLAINAWNTTGIVKLRPAVASDPNQILITLSGTAGACSSPIGMQGGVQSVGCIGTAAAGVFMHEIGHALGLIHEHKRPDRNTFVNINSAAVAAGQINQFSPIDNADCPTGPYDCGSIMHYGPTSFSVDGVQQTITVVNPAICTNIGQRTALSPGDIVAARVMYDSITGLSGKVILNETSQNGPALAVLNSALFLAWRGSGNDNLTVGVSDDRGTTFHSLPSPESSDDAPALAAHNGQLFIAYRGSGNEAINVARVVRGGAGNLPSITGKIILGGDTTDTSPAIASHGGNLYLAFRGSGNENLNVMVSTDNGATFGGKFISPETTTDAPSLVSSGGSLYIAWKGSGNENLNVATVDVGTNPAAPSITGFSNKVTFGDTTDLRPVLAQQSGLLFLGWKGSGNDNFNIEFPGDHDGCEEKFITPETTSHAPALAADGTALWVAWKGSGNDNLNVAVAEFSSQSADSIAQGLQAMNSDIFNELVQIQATLSASLQNLSQGIAAVLEQQRFANLALAEKVAQQTTMICQLEQIAKQTCDLLTEAHLQTGAQQEIARETSQMLELAETAQPAAALELERLAKLKAQVEQCCPPPQPPPFCVHAPCPPPPEFDHEPPPIDYKPIPVPPPPVTVEG